jgi:hypothetical protein
MLYNQTWAEPPKQDPFTISSLISWLEKQPPEQAYDHLDNQYCLLAQYFKAMGLQGVHMGYCTLTTRSGHATFTRTVPIHFQQIAYDTARNSCRNYTFGAALIRAKKYEEKIHA